MLAPAAATNVTLLDVDDVGVTPEHDWNVDTQPSCTVSDNVYVAPGVRPAGPHVYEPLPLAVVTGTVEPPSPVNVKLNVPFPPVAVLATVISGRLVLVNEQFTLPPAGATNVTLLAVDDVGVTPEHDTNADTQPGCTVSVSV